jgi:hypothetical protein
LADTGRVFRKKSQSPAHLLSGLVKPGINPNDPLTKRFHDRRAASWPGRR